MGNTVGRFVDLVHSFVQSCQLTRLLRRPFPRTKERMFQILSTGWEMYIRTRRPPRRVRPCSLPEIRKTLNETRIFSKKFSLAPSPLLLITHFFSVIFYSIWVVFTHPRGVKIAPAPMGRDFELALPEYQHYLYLLFKAFRMVCLPNR